MGYLVLRQMYDFLAEMYVILLKTNLYVVYFFMDASII